MAWITKELKHKGMYLNAALFVPEVKPGEKYPLVLFLHGVGESGDDLNLVKDFTPGADVFAADDWQKEHPCFVLAPQCPAGMSWPAFAELLAFTLAGLPGEYPIDGCRRYVTGLSMGGAGTWNLLCHSPQLIAAAMPICGYADPFAVRKAKHVPVWAFHAADDPVVPVTGEYRSPHGARGVGTRQVISSLRSSGNPDVHYTEYPADYMKETWNTHPHASWIAAYSHKEALEWMFSKSAFDRYEVEMICPGVFYIEDFNSDSMYLVEGREKALLIDTGLGGPSLPEVVKALTPLPVELAVTHAHGDHMALSHKFGKFYMSKKDIPLMDRMRGMMPQNTSTAEDVIDIRDGDVIDLGGVEIEVLELGGHTPGSVLFVDRTHKCLFTGDALGLWMQVPMALPISEYRENLLRVKEKLQQPGYTELAFLGGHKRQEGGTYYYPTYIPNSYEKIDDMLHLCTLLLTGELEGKPHPAGFDEPAFEATYQTANMVYKKSVLK
ncbi:MAG: MBL fold metallo-hydrolase [Clostridia bacterium]|nr:MBL fold metallo-hydrolase [Clostridia bacterium]